MSVGPEPPNQARGVVVSVPSSVAAPEGIPIVWPPPVPVSTSSLYIDTVRLSYHSTNSLSDSSSSTISRARSCMTVLMPSLTSVRSIRT